MNFPSMIRATMQILSCVDLNAIRCDTRALLIILTQRRFGQHGNHVCAPNVTAKR
jgi:hypothetical protein